MNIGIIGVGNLGLNLLNFLSEQQHEIYVSDVDGDNVEVIKNCDLIFTLVATPSLPSGDYDVSAVWEVVKDFQNTEFSFYPKKHLCFKQRSNWKHKPFHYSFYHNPVLN